MDTGQSTALPGTTPKEKKKNLTPAALVTISCQELLS